MSTEAPLQMVDCRLVSLGVEYNDEVLKAGRCDDAYDVKADAEWFVSEGESRLLVSLDVRLKPKPGTVARFKTARVCVEGQFAIAPGTPDEQAAQLVVFNAPAMLHGVARGVLAQVTGLCVGGPLILPAVNYLELLKRKAKGAAKQIRDVPPAVGQARPAHKRGARGPAGLQSAAKRTKRTAK